MTKTGLSFSDLEYLPTIKFDVANVDDYNIVGTFHPDAACDTEYFGYRETTFDVVRLFYKNSYGEWIERQKEEVEYFANLCDSRITYIVQNKIDGF